jgi:hypothetical protein
MGFLKKLMCWRKQESKKSRFEEENEVYGGPSTMEGDVPVERDAEVEMNAAVDLDAELQRDAEVEMNAALDLDAKLLRDVPMETEAPVKGDAASGGPDDVWEESEDPDYGAAEELDAGASEEPDAGASEETDAGASEEPDASASEETVAGVLEEWDAQQDNEMDEMYLERRMRNPSTEEDHEENQPHFSLWGKIKCVAGGLVVGFVTLAITMNEVDIIPMLFEDWDLCVGLRS